MRWESEPEMKELLDKGLGDLLPLVEPVEIVAAFQAPCRVLAECLLDRPAGGASPPWEGRRADELPAVVWRSVRETYPDAAVFPLGTVAQRSLQRYLWALAWESKLAEEGAWPTLETLRAHLERTRGTDRLDLSLAREYLGFWLFEAAMLDLRGVARRPELDYDLGYHWPASDGSEDTVAWRSLDQEAALREKLLEECRRQAGRLLHAWSRKKTVRRGSPDEWDWDFDQAFEEIFGVRLRSGGRREEKWPQDRRPFRVLGRRPAKRLADAPAVIAPDALLICPRGLSANVETGLSEIEAGLGHPVDGLVADLVEIAATTYFADVYVPRDELLARDLTFLVPVRYPAVWARHAELVARALGYLTQSFVAFCFTGLVGRRPAQPSVHPVAAEPADSVCLFSGGLDSFIGAADLLKEGARPVLLSHYANPALERFQESLLGSLRSLAPDAALESLRIPVRTLRNADPRWRLGAPPAQTLYQHGRAFLFLSLAAAVSLERGIGRIDVCENGPIALNPSFSESRFNTRSAHPVFLGYFRELIRQVFGVELEIRNRYATKTKGEMLARLLDAHSEWRAAGSEVLATTNSCWAYSRVRALAAGLGVKGFHGGHCGRCLPCVWRRAAFHRAGADEVDDEYLVDKVTGDARHRMLDRPHAEAIFDQIRHCQNALALSDARLLDLCPDLFEGGPESLAERLDLYRRFSREVLESFAGKAAAQLGARRREELHRRDVPDLPRDFRRSDPSHPIVR